MGRPHVEFIQTQSLPWKTNCFRHLASNVEVKILSRDADTGAASAILRIPAGWEQEGASALNADEEFFVLNGSLDLNNQTYGLHCYAYLPAGYKREAASSVNGADVIVFFSCEPDRSAPSDEQETDVYNRAVPFLDTFEMQWHSENMDPEYGDSGLCWKILRHDENSRDVTMLVSSRPHFHPKNWRGPQEMHDCVEETFLLSGDYLGDRGIMEAGTYFWRPPGIKHGPYGSRGGNLGLFRTLGADLVNNWTDNIVELTRNPAYDPVIPDDPTMEGRQPWVRPDSY